ncbi:MAG: hypothetical protein ACE5I3_11840 [Phycisphaerae bacterium]
MIGSISVQVALLAFAAAIVAGLSAGNSAVLVLQRALIAMLAGLLVGKFVSWTTKLVLRDYLQRKKLAVDQAHRASTESFDSEEPAEKPDTVETG